LWPSLAKVLEVLIHRPPLRRHPFPTLPLDHCPPLEVSLLDLHFHHLELDPHLGLVEMLVWKMTVDLVLVWALRIS
jgi:hypothetical protein